MEGGKEMRDPLIEQDENGYLIFRNSGKRVHRWVMEKKLGRRLEKGEIVHHMDGNRRDNRPENLQVLTAKEHYKLHVVPILQERMEARISEKLTPKIEAQAVKAIVIGFAGAGAILFAVGLITRTKLEMWYIGLVLLIAVLVGWFIQWRRK